MDQYVHRWSKVWVTVSITLFNYAFILIEANWSVKVLVCIRLSKQALRLEHKIIIINESNIYYLFKVSCFTLLKSVNH